MRFSVAVLLVVCLLFPFLTATHAQCMSTNTSSNITSSGGNSSQPIRANRTAEVQGNITNVPILPPFPTPSINSTSLGCPEENAVCPVVDFHLSATQHTHLRRTSVSPDLSPCCTIRAHSCETFSPVWVLLYPADPLRLSSRLVACVSLACLTQRQLMSTEEASRCPSNSTFPNITANATVAWQLPVTYRCYNKTTHSCVNGYFLCPANASSLCGVQCYDPVTSAATHCCVASDRPTALLLLAHTLSLCHSPHAIRPTIRATQHTHCVRKRRRSR